MLVLEGRGNPYGQIVELGSDQLLVKNGQQGQKY
jgi:hypothetical protein